MNTKKEYDAVIIGSGFAGIGMAIQLKQEGIENFIIIERANEIGGTWRDNRYPGSACDIPSHLYSLSFAPNPRWSNMFAPAAEIHEYMKDCVSKYKLEEKIVFNTEIVGAEFNEQQGIWSLHTSGGTELRCRVVASGVGGLVNPKYPNIPGMDRFKGKAFHSARWDHDTNLAGKRVAIIGTGASSIQIAPEVAKVAEHLTVFQRSPCWILPKMDMPISQKQQNVLERFPVLQRIFRAGLYSFFEMLAPMLIFDSPLTKIVQAQAQRHLNQAVTCPELHAKLQPDFTMGCKRNLVSSEFYPTLQRDNVSLEADNIAEVLENGIRLKTGEIVELDIIVYATGFHTEISKALFPVKGLGGRDLTEIWEGGGMAYRGVAVSGLPNWFIMMGPNTGPGHTSVLVYTEAQMKYIRQATRYILDHNIKSISIKRRLLIKYNEKLQRRMQKTVWTSGCNSWFLDASGRNLVLYPGLATEYAMGLRKFKIDEYDCA